MSIQDGADFLDEMIGEATARNPDFPALLAAAEGRRAALRTLAMVREHLDLSQTQVAARMHTSQSALARLEAPGADTKMSTFERFAAALGFRVQYRLVPADGTDHPAIVVEA